MSPTWVILTPLAAVGVAVAVRRLRKSRDRRKVGEADVIASAVHDREFLKWLDSQFDSEGRVR